MDSVSTAGSTTGVIGDVTAVSVDVEKTGSSEVSWGDVMYDCDDEVDRGEVEGTARDCGFRSTTTVTGESSTGESGRGLCASGMSNNGVSIGVEASGEMVGRTPRPTGDDTSGERGLGHSLTKTKINSHFSLHYR